MSTKHTEDTPQEDGGKPPAKKPRPEPAFYLTRLFDWEPAR